MTLAAENPTADPTTSPVVQVTGAWKLHQLGEEVVKALVDADLTVLRELWRSLPAPTETEEPVPEPEESVEDEAQ